MVQGSPGRLGHWVRRSRNAWAERHFRRMAAIRGEGEWSAHRLVSGKSAICSRV